MIKYRVIYFLVTTAIPMISALENEKETASNKNINVYLVPPSGVKQTVYRDTGSQYQPPVYPALKPDHSDDQNIAIQVLKEHQKSYIGHQPNYNVVGYEQSQPKVEFRNQEGSNTKYALEPEGPNHTKVTVKVIKEHQKTFAVDPSYIENHQHSIKEYPKPEVIYKTVEAAYPSSEPVYKESNPGYTKYIIKEDEPKEKNVFVKVVEEDKKTYIAADHHYNNDNTYIQQPEYREIQTILKDKEPRYIIKEDEPSQKEVIVKVVKKDQNSFDNDPIYKNNNDETHYRKIVPEYRNSEPQPSYKYEVKKEEPRVLVKYIKEGRKIDDSKYNNDDSYLEPVFKKSVTDYRKLESEYKQPELYFKKDEDRDKTVFVKAVKEENKSFDVQPKFNNDHKYLEPVYKKSVTEYRNSEPDYRKSETDYEKYDDNRNEDNERKVFVKEEKKTFIEDDSKYVNNNKYFEPEYRNSKSEYEKTDDEYEVKDKKPREKEVYVKVVNDEKNTFVDEPTYKNEKKYFQPEYRKTTMEYEKTEPEYRKAESDFDKDDDKDQDIKIHEDKIRYFESKSRKLESDFIRKSEREYGQSESEYNKHDDNNKENQVKKVLLKVTEDEEKTFNNRNYNNDQDENRYFESKSRKLESDFIRKSEREYGQSESEYNKHDDNNEENQVKKVLLKVTEDEEKSFNNRNYNNDQDEKRYFESKSRKLESDFNRKSEREYGQSESEYNNHDDNNEENHVNKVLLKVTEDDKKTFDNRNYDNGHQYENEYKKSEPKQKKEDDSNHDVLIKIWSKKSD